MTFSIYWAIAKTNWSTFPFYITFKICIKEYEEILAGKVGKTNNKEMRDNLLPDWDEIKSSLVEPKSPFLQRSSLPV